MRPTTSDVISPNRTSSVRRHASHVRYYGNSNYHTTYHRSTYNTNQPSSGRAKKTPRAPQPSLFAPLARVVRRGRFSAYVPLFRPLASAALGPR